MRPGKNLVFCSPAPADFQLSNVNRPEPSYEIANKSHAFCWLADLNESARSLKAS
jgi:hypothetical protein